VLQCYKGLFTGVISWFYEVLHFLLKCYILLNAEWRVRNSEGKDAKGTNVKTGSGLGRKVSVDGGAYVHKVKN